MEIVLMLVGGTSLVDNFECSTHIVLKNEKSNRSLGDLLLHRENQYSSKVMWMARVSKTLSL